MIKFNLRSVTIEPSLFLFSAIVFCSKTLVSEYLFQRISIQHGLTNGTNHDQCSNGSQYNESYLEIEKLVASETAKWNLYTSVPGTFISCFMAGIIGTWTDTVGRKPGFLIATSGLGCSMLLYCVIVKFSLPLYTLIISNIIYNLCGSLGLYTACCFSYFRDVKPLHRLTFAITVGEFSLGFGDFFGNTIGGILVQREGFLIPYICLFGMSLLCMLYTMVRFPSSTVTCRDICDLVMFKPAATLFRLLKTLLEENTLWRVAVYLSCLGMYVIARFGAIGVLVVYLLSIPFCASTFEVGIVLGVDSFMWIILIPITRIFKRPTQEYVVLVTGFFASCLGYSIMALARYTWMVYLGLGLCEVAKIGFPVLKSHISKLLPSSSQGAIFALMASVQRLSFLISSLAYNGLYSVTAKTDLPGLVLFLSAILNFIVIPVLSFVFWKSRGIIEDQYMSINTHDEDEIVT